jgi:hypothetical protein
MTKIQLDNLIHFCFLFHPSMDCNWKMQSPDYIKEKWNKYIGIDVRNFDDDKSYLTYSNIDWLKRWNVSNEDWIELKRVIRFIISLSDKPILKYRDVWKPSELIENFENQIGPVSEITQVPYNHIHALIKKEIDRWIDDNIREYNLSLLT